MLLFFQVQQPEDNVVKPEPIDLDSDEEVSQTDNKTDLHNELGFDDMQNDESYADNDVDASLLGNMDDSQNLPGASGYQGVSIYIYIYISDKLGVILTISRWSIKSIKYFLVHD